MCVYACAYVRVPMYSFIKEDARYTRRKAFPNPGKWSQFVVSEAISGLRKVCII